VAFASTAVVLVPPSADTKQLLSALGGLTTSFGTAIGEGILASLDAIAQVDPSVAPTGASASLPSATAPITPRRSRAVPRSSAGIAGSAVRAPGSAAGPAGATRSTPTLTRSCGSHGPPAARFTAR